MYQSAIPSYHTFCRLLLPNFTYISDLWCKLLLICVDTPVVVWSLALFMIALPWWDTKRFMFVNISLEAPNPGNQDKVHKGFTRPEAWRSGTLLVQKLEFMRNRAECFNEWHNFLLQKLLIELENWGNRIKCGPQMALRCCTHIKGRYNDSCIRLELANMHLLCERRSIRSWN